MSDLEPKLMTEQEWREKYADPHVVGRRMTCLTSKEWLARFKEQCSLSEPETPDEYLAAAERASGIGGQDE